VEVSKGRERMFLRSVEHVRLRARLIESLKRETVDMKLCETHSGHVSNKL
jgi:hypothetical protein